MADNLVARPVWLGRTAVRAVHCDGARREETQEANEKGWDERGWCERRDG